MAVKITPRYRYTMTSFDKYNDSAKNGNTSAFVATALWDEIENLE